MPARFAAAAVLNALVVAGSSTVAIVSSPAAAQELAMDAVRFRTAVCDRPPTQLRCPRDRGRPPGANHHPFHRLRRQYAAGTRPAGKTASRDAVPANSATL